VSAPALTESGFAAWLERYKAAWEAGDPDAAAALFAADADYAETPFAEPLRGRDAIRAYWREGAGQAQRDIRFGYTVEAVAGAVGLCRWHCTLTRVGSGERVSSTASSVAPSTPPASAFVSRNGGTAARFERGQPRHGVNTFRQAKWPPQGRRR
jgi:hypothetical protein